MNAVNTTMDPEDWPKDSTVAYYDGHAQQYFESTVGIDLGAVYDPFLREIPPGGHILDAGCGSGRDTKAFLQRGYRVTAIDASREMARLATALTGQNCKVIPFHKIEFKNLFDGVWASASLLHVPRREMVGTLNRLISSMKTGGCMYISLKEGVGEGPSDDGRFYSYYTINSIREILKQLPSVVEISYWETDEMRPIYHPGPWLNLLLRKKS